MPDAPTPETMKRVRVDSADGSSVDDRREGPAAESHKATVEDEEDQDMEDQDMEEEEDFAPGNDADYFAEEDDEGRFFGGGLTSQQKDILNIFDSAGGESAQLDVSSSR